MRTTTSIRIAFAYAAADDRRAGVLARERALRMLGAAGAAVQTSVSHLHGRGACAALPGASGLGIDLVRAGSVSVREQRWFLSRAERRQHPPLPASLRWALKEAAWKALRCSASTPFSAVELVHGVGGRVIAVRLNGVARPARSLVIEPWANYHAAIVVLEEV